MATYAELAVKLLHDAATFFRRVGEQNEEIREAMNDNASVYDDVADRLEEDPLGTIDLGNGGPVVAQARKQFVAPPGEQYASEARAWDDAGRPRLSPAAWNTALTYLWVNSAGAKQEGISAELADYVLASRSALDAAHPGWYE